MVVKQMKKRLFTSRQKKILKMISGNYCQICRKKLDENFHADHIVPFSKGGKTILKNAQALCKSCNLKKGNSYNVKA
ncbi:MAG: HNH endonuclease [Candidatus Pelagibacter bacterium]|jgi:5-methylcytosine-specific restriction endonuclease McrA|nr:HNH endonuclease [Candidatus Pelagibacter bacterium]